MQAITSSAGAPKRLPSTTIYAACPPPPAAPACEAEGFSAAAHTHALPTSRPNSDEPTPELEAAAEIRALLAHDTEPPDDREDPPVDRTRLRARLADPALQPALVQYLRKRKVPLEIAEDVAHLAWEKAIRFPRWPAENKPMLPWLKMLATFTLTDLHRSHQRRQALECAAGPVARTDPAARERADAHVERAARIAREVAAERPGGVAILAMLEARHGGKPVAAIAAEANIPEKTYYTRATRFLRAVQKRMAQVSTAARWPLR